MFELRNAARPFVGQPVRKGRTALLTLEDVARSGEAVPKTDLRKIEVENSAKVGWFCKSRPVFENPDPSERSAGKAAAKAADVPIKAKAVRGRQRSQQKEFPPTRSDFGNASTDRLILSERIQGKHIKSIYEVIKSAPLPPPPPPPARNFLYKNIVFFQLQNRKGFSPKTADSAPELISRQIFYKRLRDPPFPVTPIDRPWQLPFFFFAFFRRLRPDAEPKIGPPPPPVKPACHEPDVSLMSPKSAVV